MGDVGIQILITPEVTENICDSLKFIRSVPVLCAAIPLTELRVKPPINKLVILLYI